MVHGVIGGILDFQGSCFYYGSGIGSGWGLAYNKCRAKDMIMIEKILLGFSGYLKNSLSIVHQKIEAPL